MKNRGLLFYTQCVLCLKPLFFSECELIVNIFVLLTGLMLKKEQSDYVTITRDEIILTESGRAEKLALSDISTYHQNADNQTLTITLRDGRSLSLISENTALGGRNTDSEDAAFFASYLAEIFRNAGISAE